MPVGFKKTLKVNATIAEKDDEVVSSEEETDAHFYDKLGNDTVKEMARKAYKKSFMAKHSNAWVMVSPGILQSVLAKRGIVNNYDDLLKETAEPVEREIADDECEADIDEPSTPFTLTQFTDILKIKDSQ